VPDTNLHITYETKYVTLSLSPARNPGLENSLLGFVNRSIKLLMPTIKLLRILRLARKKKYAQFMYITFEDDILLKEFVRYLLDGKKKLLESLAEFKKCKNLMNQDGQIASMNEDVIIRSVIHHFSAWEFLSQITHELVFNYILTNKIDLELFRKLYNDFENLCYNNLIPFSVICPLHNFRIDEVKLKNIKLLQCLSIRELTLRERIQLGNMFISDVPRPYDNIKYVIEVKFNVRKDSDTKRFENLNYPENINSIFSSVVTALRLFQKGNVAIYDRFEKCSLFVPIHPLHINLHVIALSAYDGPNYYLLKDRIRPFLAFWNSNHQVLVSKALDYKRYPDDEFLNIKNAVLRFNYSYRRIHGIDAFIDNMIALEAIFSKKDDPETIATHRFAKRIALFHTKNFPDRKKLYCETVQLYKARSKIVHGEYMEGTEEIDIVKTRHLLISSFQRYFSHMKSKSFSHEKLISSLDKILFQIKRKDCEAKKPTSKGSNDWSAIELLEKL
jgi:hypothetical protein